jgi:hypothetical protein
MDKTAMVSWDIGKGLEIVEGLEAGKLKLAVALWVYLSEYEDWRLVVASRQFDSLDLREAYGLLHKALDSAGFTPRKIPTIMILEMSDSFIRQLRRLFGKTKDVEGMRLGGQSIGGRFVEDAYVYRIS